MKGCSQQIAISGFAYSEETDSVQEVQVKRSMEDELLLLITPLDTKEIHLSLEERVGRKLVTCSKILKLGNE